MEIIAVLWDFDGVVVLTPHEKAWRIASEAYGIREFTPEFYYKYVSGRPRYEGARAILEYFGLTRGLSSEEVGRLVKEFGDFKNRIFNELVDRGEFEVNVEAIEFILETRRFDKARFIHILASASKNVVRLSKIVKLGGKTLSSIFDHDVSGEGETKKEVFQKGLQRAGTYSCAVAIDDAPSGIKAAIEVGAIPIGYLNEDLTQYGAKLVIKSFKNLKPGVIYSLCLSR